jgi:hypothetical protein
MIDSVLLDAAGRRRSPATMPGFHCGRPRRNKGLRYPADPPAVEEIVAVRRVAGGTAQGLRTRALIVVLWRAGLRISEALALAESDLDRARGSVLVRRGKGGKRRQVGMDRWAWQQLDPWLDARVSLRSVRCCVSLTGRHGDGRGHAPRRARRFAALLFARACADVSLPTAPTRARRRDGPRRRAAQRDSTTTRSREPRHHVRLSARDRQQRDHRNRPSPRGADAACQRRLALAVVAQAALSRRRLALPVPAESSTASSGRPAAPAVSCM